MKSIGSVLAGVALACLSVFCVAQVMLWWKHRDDAPECVNGQPPTSHRSCITVVPAYKPK